MRDSISDTKQFIFPLRDSCIREPLKLWLRAEHVDTPNTVILQEVKISRPSARADMAVLNGEFCGFEIKSDVDSLRRLSRQAKAFNSVFDKVCLVTTLTHLKKARKAIPKWWGIMLPSSDVTKFISIRKPRKNPCLDVASLLHMLVRKELVHIAKTALSDTNFKKAKRLDIIDTILKELTEKQIRDCARDILKQRKKIDRYSSAP